MVVFELKGALEVDFFNDYFDIGFPGSLGMIFLEIIDNYSVGVSVEEKLNSFGRNDPLP